MGSGSNSLSTRLIPRSVFSEILPQKGKPELFELKLASAIRIQPADFYAENYEIEDPITIKNDVRLLNTEDK